MVIKTEFNIGDHVYFMHENKVTTDKIYRIEITLCVNFETLPIVYQTWKQYKGERLTFNENHGLLFKSKRELLNTL